MSGSAASPPLLPLPLAGVVATTTGLPAADKAAVREALAAGGARLSPTLSRRTTHLIAPAVCRRLTDKLAAVTAGSWQHVRVVHTGWLSASVCTRADEAAFAPLLPAQPRQQPQPPPQTPWEVHFSQLPDESVWGPAPQASASGDSGRLARQLHLVLSPTPGSGQAPAARDDAHARRRQQPPPQQQLLQAEAPGGDSGRQTLASPQQARWRLGGDGGQRAAAPATRAELPQLLQQIHAALEPEGGRIAAAGGGCQPSARAPAPSWESPACRVSAPGGLAGKAPPPPLQLPATASISCPGFESGGECGRLRDAACRDQASGRTQQPLPQPWQQQPGQPQQQLLQRQQPHQLLQQPQQQQQQQQPGSGLIARLLAAKGPPAGSGPQQQSSAAAAAAAAAPVPQARPGGGANSDGGLDALLSALRRATGDTEAGAASAQVAGPADIVAGAAAAQTAPSLQQLPCSAAPGASIARQAATGVPARPAASCPAPVDLQALLGRLLQTTAASPQHGGSSPAPPAVPAVQPGRAAAGAASGVPALRTAAAVAEAAAMPLPASQDPAAQPRWQLQAALPQPLPAAPGAGAGGNDSGSVADLVAALRRATESRRNTAEAAAWAADAAGAAGAADAPRACAAAAASDAAAAAARAHKTQQSVEQLLCSLSRTTDQLQQPDGAAAAAAAATWGSASGAAGQNDGLQDAAADPAAEQPPAAGPLPPAACASPPSLQRLKQQQQQPAGLSDVQSLIAALQRVTGDSRRGTAEQLHHGGIPAPEQEEPKSSAGAAGASPARASHAVRGDLGAPAASALDDDDAQPASGPASPAAACSIPASASLGSAPPPTSASGSQTGSQSPGSLAGLAAVFDGSVAADVQAALSRTLAACGGAVVPGPPYLGCAANTVVAEPEAAGRCLPLLLDIVSPAWLSRACRHASQQQQQPQQAAQLVSLSPDVARALAAQLSLDGRTPRSSGLLADSAAASPHAGAAAPPPPLALPYCALDAAISGAALAPRHMPASLLTELVWSVDEDPRRAVADDAELDAVALQPPVLSGSVVLLLPQHGSGALGHEAVACTAADPGRGLTVAELLGAIGRFYQQDVRLQALGGGGGAGGAGGAGGGSDGEVSVRRIELLGHCRILDGLHRVGRDPCSSMYEVCLRA